MVRTGDSCLVSGELCLTVIFFPHSDALTLVCRVPASRVQFSPCSPSLPTVCHWRARRRRPCLLSLQTPTRYITSCVLCEMREGFLFSSFKAHLVSGAFRLAALLRCHSVRHESTHTEVSCDTKSCAVFLSLRSGHLHMLHFVLDNLKEAF